MSENSISKDFLSKENIANLYKQITILNEFTNLNKQQKDFIINQLIETMKRVFKTNLEVTEFLINTLNRSMDLITYVEDRPGHDFRYALNSEKIRKETEWLPMVSFEEGLVQTINWYKNNDAWWRKHKQAAPTIK